VCVFLYGGNDHANTVVPFDTGAYDQYSAIRGGGAGPRLAALRWPTHPWRTALNPRPPRWTPWA